MKKIIHSLIGLLARLSSVSVDSTQLKSNKKILDKFNLWVAEKRYCAADISLGDLASDFGVSEEELSYFFSTVIGDRFTSIRKKLRIDEARRIICEHPEFKIAKVARMVGIRDKCNFRRQFHESFKMSPREWQEQCLAKK